MSVIPVDINGDFVDVVLAPKPQPLHWLILQRSMEDSPKGDGELVGKSSGKTAGVLERHGYQPAHWPNRL